jgi:adenylate kinase family enzyme
MVKYQAQIDEMLSCLYEDWMDEDDKKEFIEEIFNRLDLNYEKLNSQIEEVIKNGYSVEQQLEAVKVLLKRMVN